LIQFTSPTTRNSNTHFLLLLAIVCYVREKETEFFRALLVTAVVLLHAPLFRYSVITVLSFQLCCNEPWNLLVMHSADNSCLSQLNAVSMNDTVALQDSHFNRFASVCTNVPRGFQVPHFETVVLPHAEYQRI
jgi:hypothetical protein